MSDLDPANRTYMEDVTLDVALQFQNDNPHVTVFVQGMALEAALEYPRWDFDILRKSRDMMAKGAPIGSPAHLYCIETPATIH